MTNSKELEIEWNKIWKHEPLHKELVNKLIDIRDELHNEGEIDLYDNKYKSVPPQFQKLELPFTMLEITIMYLIAHYEKTKK